MAQKTRSERFPEYRLAQNRAGALGGRYDITSLIAAGGMAEVYEAHDTVLDRRVAVKILHATYGADAEFVERFRREAMAAGKLNHPNIVQVYDWGRSEDGAAYMVMELVEGRTLREILNEQGALGPGAAARIGEQVCAALDVARRAGIVHRDVKPENILVTPDGRVKVADFGVARALAESRATQAGVVLGSASYLAPEQVEGEPGDHRSDLYSLGTVIFEMLAATTPFRGDNPVVVAYRRVAEDVPLLRTVRKDAPEALERIVERATARRPSDRFATAAEMQAALAPLAGDASFAVQDSTRTIALPDAPTTVIRRAKQPKPARRGRRRLTLVLAALITLGLVPLGVRAFTKVAVPRVAGLTQEQAMSAIEHAGLTPATAIAHSATVPEGRVISVKPPAGSHLRRGAKVTVSISTGPAVVAVANVKGMTEANAIKTLVAEHLRVIKNEAFSPTVAKGLVVSQDPAAPTSVNEGTQITIVVSKGPELVPVPDVTGKQAGDAQATLQAAGFVVAVAHVDDNKTPKGQVVATVPAASQPAPKGSTVTMKVSNGPKEFVVPDVRGMYYNDAVALLASYGLKAGRRQIPGSYGDVVRGQDPVPPHKVKRGDTVICYTA